MSVAAEKYLARLNLEIIKAAGRAAQGQGRGNGARLPASIAGRPVRLVVVDDPAEGVRTPLGYATARRDLPCLIADLDLHDPRRRAADRIADTFERLSGAKGVSLGGADISGGLSDGGVTTKIKHAARADLIAAWVNEWAAPGSFQITRAAPAVALAVQRKTRRPRKEIRAMDAVLAICVEGRTLSDILRAHGWDAQNATIKPLRLAILAALERVAIGFGYLPKPVDA